MSIDTNFCRNVFNEYKAQNPDSCVFETYDRDTFIKVARALYAERITLIGECIDLASKDQPENLKEFMKGISTHANSTPATPLRAEFEIVACVLKTEDVKTVPTRRTLLKLWAISQTVEKLSIFEDTTDFWDHNPKILDGIKADEFRNAIQEIAGNINRLHIAITGDRKKETDRLISTLYTTDMLEFSFHLPSHPFAVTNQVWCREGTILTDQSGAPIYQTLERDILFMPPLTNHEPSKRTLNEYGNPIPRYTFTSELHDFPGLQ